MFKVCEEDGKTIEMIRGDTVKLNLSLENYEQAEGDAIRFAVKKRYSDSNPIIVINIPLDTMMLVIEPEHTKRLHFGDYVYDIELTREDGTVDTVIDRAIIKICEEVD